MTFLKEIQKYNVNLYNLLSNDILFKYQNQILKYENQQNIELVSKLLIEDFNFTNKDVLNNIEKENMLYIIQKEINITKYFINLNQSVIDKYIIGRTLGFGKTSIVKYAIKIGEQQENYALKLIPDKPLSQEENAYKQLESCYCKQISEIDVLQQCQNEDIIKLHNISKFVDKQNQKWNILVLDLCSGGNLQEYRNDSKISEAITRYIFYHIVLGINYLHHLKIAHMDIRLENILIDNNGEIKIADLGSCVSWENCEQDLIKRGSISGTISSMSPEMLQMERDFSAIKNDCWQLGLILYELLTGNPPFKRKLSEDIIVNDIIDCDYERLDAYYSEEVRDLIDHLICYNPNERYDTTQILNHPWFDDEMHKPAVAKGMILLQNIQDIEIIKNYMNRLMQEENIQTENLLADCSYLRRQSGNSTTIRFIKQKCTTQNNLEFTIQVDQLFKEHNRTNSIDTNETTGTTERMENKIISQITNYQYIIKITIFMNNGLQQSFQKLFKRLKYLILNEFQQNNIISINSRNE